MRSAEELDAKQSQDSHECRRDWPRKNRDVDRARYLNVHKARRLRVPRIIMTRFELTTRWEERFDIKSCCITKQGRSIFADRVLLPKNNETDFSD